MVMLREFLLKNALLCFVLSLVSYNLENPCSLGIYKGHSCLLSLKTNSQSPWKWMVGRWSFPFGPGLFSGSFGEGNILWPSPISGWQFPHNRRSPPLTRTCQHGMVLGPFCLQRAEDFWSFEPWTWWPMQIEICNNVGAMCFSGQLIL